MSECLVACQLIGNSCRNLFLCSRFLTVTPAHSLVRLRQRIILCIFLDQVTDVQFARLNHLLLDYRSVQWVHYLNIGIFVFDVLVLLPVYYLQECSELGQRVDRSAPNIRHIKQIVTSGVGCVLLSLLFLWLLIFISILLLLQSRLRWCLLLHGGDYLGHNSRFRFWTILGDRCYRRGRDNGHVGGAWIV